METCPGFDPWAYSGVRKSINLAWACKSGSELDHKSPPIVKFCSSVFPFSHSFIQHFFECLQCISHCNKSWGHQWKIRETLALVEFRTPCKQSQNTETSFIHLSNELISPTSSCQWIGQIFLAPFSQWADQELINTRSISMTIATFKETHTEVERPRSHFLEPLSSSSHGLEKKMECMDFLI